MPGDRKVDRYERNRHRQPIKSRQENIAKGETTHKSKTENSGNVQKYRTSSTDRQDSVKSDSRVRQGRSLDLADRYGVRSHNRNTHSTSRTQLSQDLSPKFTPRIHQRKRLNQENVDKQTSREETRYSKLQPSLEKNQKYVSKDLNKNSLSKIDYGKANDQTRKKSTYDQQSVIRNKHAVSEEKTSRHKEITGKQKYSSVKDKDLKIKERNFSSRKDRSSRASNHNPAILESFQKDLLFNEDQKKVMQIKQKAINNEEEAFTKKEELEKRNKASDEDYNYEDDFEDYESDFEDTDDIDSGSQEGDSERQENDSEISIEEKSSDGDENHETSPKSNSTLMVQQNPFLENNESFHQPIICQQSSIRKLVPATEKFKREERNISYNAVQIQYRKASKVKEQPRSFIDFASAKQQQHKQKTVNKVMKRGQEILELITLDEMCFDLFDMPPAKYDIYIRNFGRYNNKQMYVQTDNTEEEEIQTDEIEIREKWTQHPPHDYLGVGGDFGPKAVSVKHWSDHFKTDALKLNQFVFNAGQLILMLLLEEFAEMAPSKLIRTSPEMQFSQGYTKLSFTPFTKDSSVTHLCFSSIHVNYLLTLHGGLASASLSDIEEKGFICVWNLNSPDFPEYILISPSQPSCCCFGPESITIVIAGMVDGSVMLWDLRELFTWHQQVKVEDRNWVLRSPTYNSASVLRKDGHHSCVVSLCTVIYQSSSHSKYLFSSSQSYTGNMESFHVLTLEDLGVICVWIVVEITKHDPSGSETDLGLAPWGRLKLVNSSTIFLYTLPGLNEVLTIGLRTLDFQVLPSDPNHLLVTTDAGIVLHCTRYSGKAKPQYFRPESDHPAKVTSLDCSIHDVPYFLVGCDDGSIRLHSMNSEHPVMVWPGTTVGSAIKKVQWSTTLPSVFFTLDASSHMHVWDLKKDLGSPMYSYWFSESGIATFSMGWLPQIALALENGELHVHHLHDRLVRVTSEDYRHVQKFMLKL